MDNPGLFRGLWPGGYFEGDPLDPHSSSTYGPLSFDVNGISILHNTYLKCIKPYIDSEKVALEIGPGRGAWSKCMIGFEKLYVVDVLSPLDTKFLDYVKDVNNTLVTYITTETFSFPYLFDEEIDYCFSFGCLCHVSTNGIEEYAYNLFRKLSPGANCFWMFGDATKYHRATGKSIPVEGPGRWYGMETADMAAMLRAIGYKVIEEDIGTCPRDPIVHFKK